MKTCSKCKVAKDEAEFSKDKNNKDGLHHRCKSCIREYQQTDAFKETQKAYHHQSDVYKEYQKAYRQTDAFKEITREYRKAHRQTDAYKEKHREYAKAYYLRKKAAASATGNVGQSGDTNTLP